MAGLIPVSVREANQDLSGLLARVAERGEGYVITKRGRPIARLLPMEEGDAAALTPEQQAALDDLFAEKLRLGGGRLNRDELHER
jgi:prevent-host-death family protein